MDEVVFLIVFIACCRLTDSIQLLLYIGVLAHLGKIFVYSY